MEKLDWEFVESRDGGNQSANYRGLVIEAHQDSDAENPWTSWDNEPPLAVRHGGDRSVTAYGDGLDPLAAISDGLLQRHWRAIAKALDLNVSDCQREALESQRDYGGRLVDIKREMFDDALGDMSRGNIGDYFESIAALWGIAKCEALTWTSRGYSQGDWADCLLVATPSWAKESGCKRRYHAQALQIGRRLYDSWANSEVYCYTIKGPGGIDLEGEAFDSCWGFYGRDHGDSGLEEQAMNAADCIIAGARKRRNARLRELITNRVPLDMRARELALIAGNLESVL